jgi:hypothetical protein
VPSRCAYYSPTAGESRRRVTQAAVVALDRSVRTQQGERNLAKPNFEYQKRQKELEKKRKKEEKLKKRQERAATPPAEGAPPNPEPGETP